MSGQIGAVLKAVQAPAVMKGLQIGVGVNDISTSGVKAVVVAQNGQVFESHSVPHKLDSVEGRMQQNPQVWMAGMKTANAEAVQLAKDNNVELRGASNTFRMHELFELGADGQVLADPTSWCSNHAKGTIAGLSEGAKARLRQITGNNIFARSGIRLAWERFNRPDVYWKIAKFTTGEGYLAWLMTGGALSDVAIPVDEAGMTLLMETRRFTWADEAFELMGIDLLTSARPRVLRVMDTVGHITVRAAAEFGWPKDIPYIIGGGDQTTGLAGNGGNGIVLGSSGVFSANVRSYKPDPTGVFHFLPNGFGKWYYMVCTQNCCTSLDWLAEQPFAKEKSIPELLQIARDAKLPVDNDDLIFLPTEGGAIHPIQIVDPKAQGGFYGETTKNNTLAHKVNAVLEAITADLAIGFKLVCKKAGFRPERLILSGGGAKDGMRDGTGYWPQMIADWTGVPVVINETTKAGSSALGAAMFAGINPEVALWPDLKTAQNILVRLGAQYSPRGDWFEKYAAQTHRYLQIFSVIHLGGDLYGYQKILGNDGY